VGRRAREILIDLAALVFTDDLVDPRALAPKKADAKARLHIFLDAHATGAAHAELRQLVRTVWDLAQKVTHSEDVGRVDAFAVSQATVFLVRVFGELAQ